MQLHQLKGQSLKRKLRIGRGGKRGSYSGRGVKGQHSRSGRRIRPAERDLILRLPKLRGFFNKPKSEKPLVLNVKDIARHAQGKAVVVDMTFLKSVHLVPKKYKGTVKILGMGEIGNSVTVQGIALSKSAQAKLGGKK